MQFKLLEVIRNLNNMLVDTENAKLSFLNYILSLNNKIIYIDLDLVTTGYVKSNVIKPKADLELYIPADIKELKEAIFDACISMNNHIIIIDSLDTFEILYGEHLLSIYLSILLLHAKNTNSKIIVISRIKGSLEYLFEVILYIDGKKIVKHPDHNIINLGFDYY